MMGMGITSNLDSALTKLQGFGAGLETGIDKAVGEAAKAFMKDCITEIDAMIYSQPASSSYTPRTKNLRRSHHIKRVVMGVWLVFNEADYALPVHDGWKNSRGGSMPPKPWMDVTARKNTNKYKEIIEDSMKGMFA